MIRTILMFGAGLMAGVALPGVAFTPTVQGQGIMNLPPLVRILAPSAIAAGQIVTLRAIAADPDPGDAVYYCWVQTDGEPISTSARSSSILVFVAQPGVYGWSLWVKDYHGGTAETGITITVPQG